MFHLDEELKKLPDKPGVYLMHDAKDVIIYVGKAISLKNRVRQYFQPSRNVTAKIQRMIDHIAYFEYIVTDSELEALVLECNLIKEHSPRYNTMLKDGKSYPFLKATIHEAFPRLLFAREMKRDHAKYFGPFTSGSAIKDTIDLLNRTYHLRQCNRILPRDIEKERPCLYYQMKQCDGPCQGYVDQEGYRINFAKALSFLEGNTKVILSDLEQKMQQAAADFQFEEAAAYRDMIGSAKAVTQRQKITSSQMDDRDVIAMARCRDQAVMQVFFLRDGKMIGREHYFLTGVEEEEKASILSAFIKQMYAGTPYIPKELLVETQVEDEESILSWLTQKRGSKVSLIVPKRGQKERLLELASRNARMILDQDAEKLKNEQEKTAGAIAELGELLSMDIHRVESYDISNMNGFETVGSMVVYEEGKPKKNDYRKFRIRSVSGPDDYGAMEEMLTRRFTHAARYESEGKDSFSILPDLILMDGGKGQVNVCEGVLQRLDIHVPVCGMVKDDHHRTRGLYFHNEEVPMDTHSQCFRLVTRIQDETHRFAIEYHRSLRSKGQVKSVLDDITGIGPKRRNALMRYYQSTDRILEATVEEISQIPSMDEKSAQAVYDFFQKGKDKSK